MAIKVFDSWALMALFNDEAAADAVEVLLRKASAGTHTILMSVINWGEIYYSVMRGASSEMTELKEREIAAMPIELVAAHTDLNLVRQAAIYKATYRISYADAFAAALAKLRKAELVTGDAEFKSMEKELKIHWLPRG